MGLCIASFISIFAFVFGIAILGMVPGSMAIIVEEIVPLPMGIMFVGFVASIIVLLVIRSFGDYVADIENKTLSVAIDGLSKLALVLSLLLCALQVYLRITYNEWGFFVTGDNFNAAFNNASFEDNDYLLFFIGTASTLFLGLPLYIIAFFNGDFGRYVTVTHTQLSDGETYESGRSESYITVGQFIIMGLLLTVPFIVLSNSMLCYLFPAGFAALKFAKHSKKALTTALIIFGVIALGLLIFNVLPLLGVAF